MPKRCVAANCSNTIADGVSLFRFPRDAARRRQWVLQVKRTRARWDFPAVYNASCVLFSDHFEADCFDPSSSVKLSVGYDLKHKRVLLDTAVPTIFVRTVTLKQQASHKSTASAGAPSSSTAVSSVDVATVTDIDGSTLLVPIESTKVVATTSTSSTRGRTSSRSVLAKKERIEVRKFVHFVSCKHWLFHLLVAPSDRPVAAGFGLGCCCLD